MSRHTKAARLRARRAWDARAAFLRAASDRPPGPPSAAVMASVDAAWDRFRDTPGNRAHKRRVFGMARECLAALEPIGAVQPRGLWVILDIEHAPPAVPSGAPIVLPDPPPGFDADALWDAVVVGDTTHTGPRPVTAPPEGSTHVCRGCGNECQSDVCWCGADWLDHAHGYACNGFRANGCTCGFLR